MTKSTKLQFVRFSAICVLIAMIALIVIPINHLYWESKESLTWPNTTGEIIILERGYECIKGTCDRYPKISYSYIVGGQKYIAKRFEIFGRPIIFYFGDYSIDTYLESLKRNKNQITVYYNPQDFSQALLIPGQKSMWQYLAGRIFGIAFISFLLFLFMMAFINPP